MYGNNRFPGLNRHFGRFFLIAKGHTDNGRTQTDIFFYRDARTHLKKYKAKCIQLASQQYCQYMDNYENTSWKQNLRIFSLGYFIVKSANVRFHCSIILSLLFDAKLGLDLDTFALDFSNDRCGGETQVRDSPIWIVPEKDRIRKKQVCYFNDVTGTKNVCSFPLLHYGSEKN